MGFLDHMLEWNLLLLLQKGQISFLTSILGIVLTIHKGKKDHSALIVERGAHC